MAISGILLAALASSASAVRLFASSYDGNVSTFELTGSDLKVTHQSKECGQYPSWLEIQKITDKKILYCVDEGWGLPNSTLTSLNLASDGSLQTPAIAKQSTIISGVYTSIFNAETKPAIAVAHFDGSAFSTFTKSADGKLSPLQNQTFTIPKPGPNPMQDRSRIHAAVVDPTGQYLIFPDYGADLVRVWAIDKATSQLTEKESLPAPTGSGPRHAVFWSPDRRITESSALHLFVVHEIGNIVSSHKIGYKPNNGGLTFAPAAQVDFSTFGKNKTAPVGAKAAEIQISPDNQFIIVSNRNATIAQIDNPDPKNSTKIASDSLIIFKPKDSGLLEQVDIVPSGGSGPRHFSLNKDGSMVAVANQDSGTVTVWRRDARTGGIKERVAVASGLGMVNMVIWDEDTGKRGPH